MQERIQGLRHSAAKISQRLEAPKTWIGSSGGNVLQVLCDLLDLVEQMNSQLAAHKHGPTSPPDNAIDFNGNAANALMLSGKLNLSPGSKSPPNGGLKCSDLPTAVRDSVLFGIQL